MSEYCWKRVEDQRCLLFKGHSGVCNKRQSPEQPPLDKQIWILEIAADGSTFHLWARIWTFSNSAWLTWMVDEGLLTEEPQETHGGDYVYGGFSGAIMAPFNRITEKGRAMLAHHIPVAWVAP